MNLGEFQYRKRYGLHAIGQFVLMKTPLMVSIPQAVWIACNHDINVLPPSGDGFNTASGMDCMQLDEIAVCYRINDSFNTASGMDCMQ